MSLEDDVRKSVAGYWDRFVGPGQSAVEAAGWAVIAAVTAVRASATKSISARSRGVLAVIAVDLWAGAWVNNSPSCVRWYERRGQGVTKHLSFAILHAAHPALIAVLDVNAGSRSRSSALRWASVHTASMVGSTAVITAAPRRARLPIAIVSSVLGIALDRPLGASRSAPWFAPAFYSKLLIGHAAGSIWNAGPAPID